MAVVHSLPCCLGRVPARDSPATDVGSFTLVGCASLTSCAQVTMKYEDLLQVWSAEGIALNICDKPKPCENC